MSLIISEPYIGNLALSHIGISKFIQSLSESSNEARIISLHFPGARREALSAFDWNFARKRQALALHSEEAPEGDWTFRYQYPEDCLRAREIENPFGWQANSIPFRVEPNSTGTQQTILTDAEDAKLIYTFDQTNYSMYSEDFVKLLSYLLAYHIAWPLTQKEDIKRKMLDLYSGALFSVSANNANEGVRRGPRDAPQIRVRGVNTNRGTIFDEEL